MFRTEERRSDTSAAVAKAEGLSQTYTGANTYQHLGCHFLPSALKTAPTLIFSILASENPSRVVSGTLGELTLILARFLRGVCATPRTVTIPAPLSLVMSATPIPLGQRQNARSTHMSLQLVHRLKVRKCPRYNSPHIQTVHPGRKCQQLRMEGQGSSLLHCHRQTW